jgi:phosphatidylglycerol:prolipoprotein diacylglycerol transferase
MSYFIFMTLAVISAIVVSRFTSKITAQRIPISASQRAFIGLAGFVGAVTSAKLPFVLLTEDVLHNAGTIVLSGKTILLGLVGGYLGVELGKLYLGIKTKTGDSFAVPVATAIGVGRLGCFFGGCCYGIPTELPWGTVFPTVDLIARHPTQIYECVFHLTMALFLYWALVNGRFQGQLIKLYFLSYFAFRFLTEFLRPEIDWWGGLSAYQWAIVFLIPMFGWLWWRDHVSGPNR